MILITGSLAYDQIMDFPGSFSDHIIPDKIHILNVSFLVNTLRKGFGGTAGNIAYTLSLLGIKTSILGLVGKDFSSYRNFLEINNIKTNYIKQVNDAYTSTAFGITDKADNQIWGFYSGADEKSDVILSIKDVKEEIEFGIIAPHNPKTMLSIASEYKERKIPYLFDPGMQLPWLTGENLKTAFSGAKVIIGNDYEVSVMEKKTKINNLNKFSHEGKIVITTLGAHGSRIATEGRLIEIKSAKAKNTTDPTGAGDAYRGGFMAGFIHGLPLDICGKMGSVAAVYTVEKYGTTTHNYSFEEFCSRFEKNYKQRLSL